MDISLLDVDGHSDFRNIVLMKASAYHKELGDHTEIHFPMKHYDKTYMSKVFDFTEDYKTCINSDEIIMGGRAYDKKKKLPIEIETMYPDYDLYGVKEAMGYLTRGCPRGCGFCDVKNIEGLISHKVANLNQFWKNQKQIKLLDPNTLACKEHINLLEQLVESNSWVDFTQGLDARLLTEKNTELIKQIKIKMIHFAWDDIKQSDLIIKNLKMFKETTNLDFRRLRVYVLVNYDTSFEEDLFRVYNLKSLGYDPFVMVYDKYEFVNQQTNRLYPLKDLLKKYTMKQIDHFKKIWKMQRWVDNKFIFRSCETFEDYMRV